ncbi:L,D-transpeptidase [Moraxella haemolytica]|uniref:L,D-transpeptidase n=1 Tax=Moraxella TaxID=475 RepID=UPI00254378A3|nr:L,D-transpeptidase [Moraxella sp. ZY171148]WII95788.1 L,D-transpeptidase [Moraxella sp. ZY171148]
MNSTADSIHLHIDTTCQKLSVFRGKGLVCAFSISTAKNGVGQFEGTGCTPLGRHIISDKIGGEYPVGAVFVGRRFTGEIYDDKLGRAYSDRDWILSRILWLKGTEDGYNLGKTADGMVCDTHARYIYIHGTPDTEPMGVPMSHGCVRMRNSDVVRLYDMVGVGTPVLIV